MITSKLPAADWPLTNVSPFTYRAGITYAELLEEMRSYIETKLTPELNTGLTANVEQMINALAESDKRVIESVEEFERVHDAFMADVDGSLQALNDGAIGGLLGNDSSQVVQSLKSALGRILADPHSDGAESLLSSVIEPAAAPDFSRAYRKRIVHNLPIKHPDWNAALTKWGHAWPQGLTIDEKAGELFIVSFASDTGQWQVVTVYDWTTGAYKTAFGINTSVVSEAAVIRYESGRRYLYLRTAYDRLDKYDVTVLPAPLTNMVSFAHVSLPAVSTKFTHKDGRWTIQSSVPGNASYGFNNQYVAYNEEFTPLRQLMLSGHATGPGFGSDLLPKTQGIAEGAGVYGFSMGANYAKGSPVTMKDYFGVRIVSGTGNVMLDALVDPAKALAKLDALGYETRCTEAEGMVYSDGKFYSLLMINSWNATTTDGILVCEEFSAHPDAIDFSDCAMTVAAADTRAIQTGIHPRGADGKLHNPNNYPVILDTIPKILDYMESVEQSVFTFYSTTVTVKDCDGVDIPAGQLVRVYNGNNSTHFMQIVGNDDVWYRILTSGSVRNQSMITRKAVAHSEAVGVASFASVAVGAKATVAITFPEGRFNVAPAVMTAPDNADLVAAVYGLSATGATIQVRNVGTAPTPNQVVRWHAVQMSTVSANG